MLTKSSETVTPMTPPPAVAKPSFLSSMMDAWRSNKNRADLEYGTTVHPCVIDGVRTLFHRRNLHRNDPLGFKRLAKFAVENGFALREDRRREQLSCRNERRRILPLLTFAAGSLLPLGAAVAETGTDVDIDVAIPEITVYGKRPEVTPEKRGYRISDGKRFLDEPQGDIERILAIAGDVRATGKKRRVRLRGLQMPAEYPSSFIDRYDVAVPKQCGGGRFSFYEGEGFGALGYDDGSGTVVVDVLAGGSPFAGPRLWGPYDQVINASSRMKLVMGNGDSDSMGLLKASYKIGLMPTMEAGERDMYAERYVDAVERLDECAVDLPVVKHDVPEKDALPPS